MSLIIPLLLKYKLRKKNFLITNKTKQMEKTNEVLNEEQKSDKNYLFVGNCRARTNKWNVEEINLGFSADHLKVMIENLNEKGWINIALRVNKAGSRYMYIVNPIMPDDANNE